MRRIWLSFDRYISLKYDLKPSTNLSMAYDGIHLSEEGHHKFAEKIAEWIRYRDRPCRI